MAGGDSMTDTQDDAAQGAPGGQACGHEWETLMVNALWRLQKCKLGCGSYWLDGQVLVPAPTADHNAVRELREALAGLVTKYEEVVEMYVRPNMDCRAKDSSGDVEYTAARAALAHAQGAEAEIPAMWSKDDPPDYVEPAQGAGRMCTCNVRPEDASRLIGPRHERTCPMFAQGAGSGAFGLRGMPCDAGFHEDCATKGCPCACHSQGTGAKEVGE